MKKKILGFITIFIIGILCTACQDASGWEEVFGWSEETERIVVEEIPINQETDTLTNEEPVSTVEETETEPAFEEYDISLMAVGDNLMHMGIVYTGKMSDGTWNYDCLFDELENFLNAADIKMINQETILGGNERGFSGFPHFNSPTEVGDAIAAAGFNVVTHGSNHAADQGLPGLQSCATFWEQYPEVLVTGIHKEEQKEHEIPLLTIEGVTFAILNYTYSPNTETLSGEIQGHLDMLCDWDENTGRIDFTTIHPDVLADIERADQLADVVIVCPHWGTEYTSTPSTFQETFARQMTQAGADVIIGTHPHVVQPVEWVESENGNRALCYYSLGNYVSTQQNPFSMLEAMAWVTFRVTEDGVAVAEEGTGVIPMVCHYTSGPVRLEQVYMLEDYTAEKAAEHGIRNYGGVALKLEDLQKWSDEVLGEYVISVEQVLEVP